MYAGELLSIAAMASAKTSAVLLSDRVAPRDSHPYYGMLGLIAFWGAFSFLAIALQCGIPDPWAFAPDRCPSKGALYYPIISLNIVTDGLLALWILPTVWKLLMNHRDRITVIALFGSRLMYVVLTLLTVAYADDYSVCAFATVQLVTVTRHIRDPDVTCTSFRPNYSQLGAN